MFLTYFQGQGIFVLKIVIAALLGLIAAWDRRKFGKGAGMRTYAIISMGACLFALTSSQFSNDPARVAAGIVTGIGFIGAGIIWQKKDDIVGVTTAAGIWSAAAIGLAVAVDLWLLAIVGTIMITIIFNLRRILPWS